MRIRIRNARAHSISRRRGSLWTRFSGKTAMPTDTFSLIRSLLESNQQEVANAAVAEDDEKVLTRSCKSFVTERPKKSWDDYERRSAHRHTGFDSIPHVPYRPFAGLKHIDAYPLVADTWRVRLDRPNNSEERVKVNPPKSLYNNILCILFFPHRIRGKGA